MSSKFLVPDLVYTISCYYIINPKFLKVQKWSRGPIHIPFRGELALVLPLSTAERSVGDNSDDDTLVLPLSTSERSVGDNSDDD